MKTYRLSEEVKLFAQMVIRREFCYAASCNSIFLSAVSFILPLDVSNKTGKNTKLVHDV
jgi:hypothetical protein